ncbi:glycosyltransferase family 4 protein [Wenzhouxiangella sediminis]|uniref:Glycosyltransferase family 1 protein n=1 Tax=Wenzhouxiangella sediminis TaxID=1792836 RepID=A0A3E1K5D6_9GAMM|nr:glycosyltransferase family 1 protein [Wenzhouxiangella sediminis]RFF29257.1 glycosyltransferase family 1 protein [Wenzhouxiangella sediminis]
MNILLVTDAWAPQVNGVVRTLERTRDALAELGHRVTVLSPAGRTLPCPGYPEIRLALRPRKLIREAMTGGPFDAIHIATEGPLGLAASRWCRRHGLPFTTSYHTRFPEYLRMRAPVPLGLSYAYMRWFHSRASRTFVRTPTQKSLLTERGFRNLHVWPGGVDTQVFRPRERDRLRLPRPISLYAGRVAVEKNIEAFLKLDLPGAKVVIGDGPALAALRERYPGVHFLGYRHGEELAGLMSSADVFVFPSRTDTLGLVILESMACGVPVAAFPVPGPADLVTDGGNGALDEDLREAVFRALSVDGDSCAEFAGRFSWDASTRRFLGLLKPVDEAASERRYNPAPCHSPPPDPKPASIGLPN